MAPFKVCAPIKNEKTGKTYWMKIGVAFKRDDGGMSCILDALPIGREFMIFPPDERGNRAPAQNPDADDVPY